MCCSEQGFSDLCKASLNTGSPGEANVEVPHGAGYSLLHSQGGWGKTRVSLGMYEAVARSYELMCLRLL